jgi:LCP family protein required for cell wall assembly
MRNTSRKAGFPHYSLSGDMTNNPKVQLPTNRLRILVAIASGVILIVATVAGIFGFAARNLAGNIKALEVIASPKPVAETGPLNILLMGTDTRTDQGGGFGSETEYGGTGRSDTTILIHLSNDRKSAIAVSIPRDSVVNIPACTKEDGTTVTEKTDLFNSAFASAGPGCTVKTIETLTGITINHAVIVDFVGFSNVVDALGGIKVCLTEAIDEPVENGAGIQLPAGVQTLDGKNALGLMRARYSLADGSDLKRIERQQELLSITIDQVTKMNLITDLPALYKVLNAATSSLRMDAGLSDLDSLVTLTTSLSSMGSKNVSFVTVPYEGTPDGNHVQWTAAATELWSAIINDTGWPPSEVEAAPSVAPTAEAENIVVKPSDVTAVVLNGTKRSGFGALTGEYLKTQGVNIAEVGNAPNKDTAESVIVHTSGNALKAQLIGQLLGITNIAEDPQLAGGDVAIILGNNAPTTWTAPANPVVVETPVNETPAPKPSPSAIAAPESGLFCPLP